MDLSYIIAPLTGGVIGYITNAIAIKMLFRPHTEKRLFGMKIPFTPGIIPKRKGKIAASLGGAISENLMNKDVLEKNLLSEEMVNKIQTAITEFFEKQKHNDETLRQFLLHYLTAEDVDNIFSNVKTELSGQIASKLQDTQLGDQIADVAAKHVTDKIRSDGIELNIPGLLARLIGPKLWNKLADLLESPIKRFLSKNINQMLARNGKEIAGNLITNEISTLENTPVKTLLKGKDPQIEQFIGGVVSIYKMVISSYLPKILSAIDIPKTIEDRVNEMDISETEEIIFQVMDKELKAIVWLGALLGVLMGCINLIT